MQVSLIKPGVHYIIPSAVISVKAREEVLRGEALEADLQGFLQ